MTNPVIRELKAAIRSIPGYPKPGIIFRDITTLLGDNAAFHRAVDELVNPFFGRSIDKIAAIEARGFILGGAMAYRLSAGFVPLRKKGRLPWKTYSAPYELEYGEDELQIHIDAVKPGEHVVLVDDLLATGGTAIAALELLKKTGARVIGACFLVDLPDLGGSKKLEAHGLPVRTLIRFEGD